MALKGTPAELEMRKQMALKCASVSRDALEEANRIRDARILKEFERPAGSANIIADIMCDCSDVIPEIELSKFSGIFLSKTKERFSKTSTKKSKKADDQCSINTAVSLAIELIAKYNLEERIVAKLVDLNKLNIINMLKLKPSEEIMQKIKTDINNVQESTETIDDVPDSWDA